ncbi:(2Fe-2S) ferredoxin domain-containing protein [Sphingomonas hengshuiensis]|uniref:Ferredoxin n=1 Tax=Sphingomonas hengshuiensis TaxID=1609977 RepID=A0A7U4J9G3_9SPHN|nr:(2Fe-2S) ferredoxin domain-containing protein [Sphingomonas hengshuiensis]AJP72705.1 ferredoxin [Sphingomonas hengshuiensis]
MELPEELPQLYKRHIFACHTQRPPQHPRGSCGAAGAGPLWERLGKRIEALDLTGEVGFTASGCLGFCSAGPLIVIYPEGVWYKPQSEADIDLIVEHHLQQDRLVEDLVVVLSR